MDFAKWNPNAPPASYDCVDQGVTPGWEDISSSGLPCHFINMDCIAEQDRAPDERSRQHRGAWSGFQQFAYMGWNGSQWSAVTRWSNISVASPPGLVATGPEQLMAAVSGADDRPYIVMLNGSTWSTSLTSPTGFGGMHFRVPVLVSWATNRVDLIYSLSLSRVGHLSWF